MQNLIFLHGALGCKSDFDELVSIFENDFNVHVLNFNGHGGNEFTSDVFTIKSFMDDVLFYMSAHNLSSAFFFGYSMGGYVAIQFALHYPEKVQGIFTLATKFDWNPENSGKEAGMLNPDKVIQKIPAFAAEQSLKHGSHTWKRLMTQTSMFILDLGMNHLIEDDFRKVQCPVRICVGDKDKMVDVHSSFIVSQQLRHGSFLVLPDTNHPLNNVGTDRLKYEIATFF